MAQQSAYDPEKFILLQAAGPEPDAEEKEWTPKVPIAVILGHYEKLTEEEFEELRADIAAETIRRNTALARGDDS